MQSPILQTIQAALKTGKTKISKRILYREYVRFCRRNKCAVHSSEVFFATAAKYIKAIKRR